MPKLCDGRSALTWEVQEEGAKKARENSQCIDFGLTALAYMNAGWDLPRVVLLKGLEEEVTAQGTADAQRKRQDHLGAS